MAAMDTIQQLYKHPARSFGLIEYSPNIDVIGVCCRSESQYAFSEFVLLAVSVHGSCNDDSGRILNAHNPRINTTFNTHADASGTSRKGGGHGVTTGSESSCLDGFTACIMRTTPCLRRNPAYVVSKMSDGGVTTRAMTVVFRGSRHGEPYVC